MYPSSTSSSSQGSMGPSAGTSSGLMRYGSAPSAFLSTAVESVIRSSPQFSGFESHNHHHQPHNPTGPSRFFSMETSSFASDQSNKTTSTTTHSSREQHHSNNGLNINTTIGLQRSYGIKQDPTIGGGLGGGGGGGGMVSSSSTSTSPLVRHSSTPAGFLNHLAHAATSNEDSGFSITRGHAISRLNSQLSFTRQEPLSQITEENENVVNNNGRSREREQKNASHPYATTSNYGVGSWEDGNSLMFSVGPSKREKNISSDIVNGLNSMETQFQFGMPHGVIEMSTMDKLLNIPQDSIPCKIRAKRGCATHPRSIAERERRTRISGKLKKLQELVPNMDKQTSYSDMLDLAVQHIKGLQNQVQKLNKELDNCKCGCRDRRNAGREEKS